eukprot:s2140_g15.t1
MFSLKLTKFLWVCAWGKLLAGRLVHLKSHTGRRTRGRTTGVGGKRDQPDDCHQRARSQGQTLHRHPKVSPVRLRNHRSQRVVCLATRFGAASSPNRKSRLDSLDEDVIPAAAPAKASGGGPSLFGSGRLAKNIFDDEDDDDVVKQDGRRQQSLQPFWCTGSGAGTSSQGEIHVAIRPRFGTAASAPSTRKPRLDSNDEDVPAPAPAPAAPAPAAPAAAAAVPFAPPTLAAKASSGGPGGPSLFGGSGRLAKDIFDDDDDDDAAPSGSSSLFGAAAAAPKASAEQPEKGEVVSKAASAASAAEPSKPVGGLFGDNEVRSNPLFGTAVPFAPPTVAAKASSGAEGKLGGSYGYS